MTGPKLMIDELLPAQSGLPDGGPCLHGPLAGPADEPRRGDGARLGGPQACENVCPTTPAPQGKIQPGRQATGRLCCPSRAALVRWRVEAWSHPADAEAARLEAVPSQGQAERRERAGDTLHLAQRDRNDFAGTGAQHTS
jgi:hypothetical protein